MISRCLMGFVNRLNKTDLSSDSFKQLLAEMPETCVEPDCTPGGCRSHCREWALGEWAKIKYAEAKAA